MSNYNNGVNDALMGAAIGDVSVGFANFLTGKRQERKENNEMWDNYTTLRKDYFDLDKANSENVKNGLIWKDRAVKAAAELEGTRAELDDADVAIDKLKKQSKNRLIDLMSKSGDLNKSHAMELALRENVDELFEADKIDYSKEQFDNEVNEDYKEKRLELDKELQTELSEYGGGEGWVPKDDYLGNNFKDFK